MSPLAQLEALEPAAPLADVLAFYDSLPGVAPEAMRGRWRGGEIATGHLYDGLLGPSGWWGKAFRSIDDVDPLLFERGSELLAANPALLPLGLIERFPRLAKSAPAAALFRAVVPLLRTGKPRARLRPLTYRGVTSAAMIYDAHPIADCFRAVTPDVLLGAMDIRGHANPFVFTLRRVATD
ncbi:MULTISPECIES: GXWXG domain-containing protein [Sphingomonas]|uniref:GXWXG domain-containing protein n=1 Tax=Sphingomonas TaxID=13687 RepID=UPI000DF01E77|nr:MULTISPECIES: GXWXG domain-containing protein [Sphingomonas]